MSKSKQEGPRFPTSIRVKCDDQLKSDVGALAASWSKRKSADYDMSKLVRTLLNREIARERRLLSKRRRSGKA